MYIFMHVNTCIEIHRQADLVGEGRRVAPRKEANLKAKLAAMETRRFQAGMGGVAFTSEPRKIVRQ